MADKPIRHCRNCQKPIHFVSYLTSDRTKGFWMHTGGRRHCPLVADPIPMDDGIEYM